MFGVTFWNNFSRKKIDLTFYFNLIYLLIIQSIIFSKFKPVLTVPNGAHFVKQMPLPPALGKVFHYCLFQTRLPVTDHQYRLPQTMSLHEPNEILPALITLLVP